MEKDEFQKDLIADGIAFQEETRDFDDGALFRRILNRLGIEEPTSREVISMGLEWGDKGCVKDLSKCEHPANDGCMWCCMQCNTDTHRCPNCGTVSNHKETMCGEKPEDCYTDLGGR